MPIVPEFHGNIPQVRSNGGAGVTPAQVPAADLNAYGRMMRDAMKPVNAWSESLTEALRIEHQRTVKAESDDAERQVIDAINARMSGENGYLTQQGKNAMDAFKPTVDGMTADIDQIVGNLQPQVREVIGSRIQDRLSSAVEQAQRWNGQQTRQYHLSSSEAKLQSLMTDADNHYAELPYLQKTWGSIVQEIDYQGTMLGLPAEQIKLTKDKNYDLFQARRFEAWGADNPVQALQVFRSQKPQVSADIANKIEAGLFAKSRDTLALNLAQRPVVFDEDGKIKNLAWMNDPGAATGDSFIDSLKNDQRLSVVLRARQLRTQMIQARSDEFKRVVANNLAETLMGNSPQPLSEDQFVEAYGPKVGVKQFEQYSLDRTENQFKADARFMSDADITQTLKAFKPKQGAENFAAEIKSWQAMNKAAQSIVKDRQKDKIGFALSNEYGSFQPLNWGNQDQVRDQLTYRVSEMNSLAQRWGGDVQLISNHEASELVKTLDEAGIDERLSTLRTIADIVGDEGIAPLSRQLKDGAANYAIAASAMNEFPAGGSISTGEMYLRGRDAIEQKRVKLDEAAVLGIQAQVFNALGDSDDAEAVFTDPRVLDASRELVEGVAGYKILTDGSASTAIESALGKIENHNGKKIILPSGTSGWFGDDFDDKIEKESERIRKSKGRFFVGNAAYTAEQLADELPQLKLQTYSRLPDGGVSYLILRNGQTVMNARTNEPVLLEIFGQ